MQAISKAVMGLVLFAALALAGCASGGSSSGSASAAAVSRLRTITLASPTVAGGSATTMGRDTCDGKNASVPLNWNPVPEGTRELLVVMLSLKPEAASEGKVRLNFVPQWVVAGLSPTVRRIVPGRLPPGAILGRNADGSSRYPLCPAKGKHALYAIMVFAASEKLAPSSGFSDSSIWAELSQVKPPYGQLLVAFSRT